MRDFMCEADQGLVIDGQVRVTVLEIGPDFVRLGIVNRDEGPYREEIVRFDRAELEPVPLYN